MEDKVRVIDRVFDILEALAESTGPLGITELSNKTDMSKSTISRLVNTMCNRHYVEKTDSGKYTIGYKFMEIAGTHINNLELITEAKPFLLSLGKRLNLTAHLGILDGQDVVYLEKMDTIPDPSMYTEIGTRSPAYCSSLGKCLLSSMSGTALDEALETFKFQKYTPNTITNHKELRQRLKEVRRNEWAMDDEEFKLGHRCIAASIYDYRGLAVAAISVSGSKSEISDDRIEEIVNEVKLTAHALSVRMGHIN